jgi:hypothetical protein
MMGTHYDKEIKGRKEVIRRKEQTLFGCPSH